MRKSRLQSAQNFFSRTTVPTFSQLYDTVFAGLDADDHLWLPVPVNNHSPTLCLFWEKGGEGGDGKQNMK